MTKEEKFKNKSIKKKVNDAFNMIFRLYFCNSSTSQSGIDSAGSGAGCVPYSGSGYLHCDYADNRSSKCYFNRPGIQVVNLLYCKTNPGIKRCSRASFPWRIT